MRISMATEILKFLAQSIKTKASRSGEIQCFPTGLDNNQGWQWGRVGLKDKVFVPTPLGFVLPYSRPAPHKGENFLIPSSPLRVLRSLTPSRKTLLFVNFPYNQYNFFNETYFINILEITTKFILSNKLNLYKKKLNNISKRLTRQSPKKKKKSHSVTQQNNGKEPHWIK